MRHDVARTRVKLDRNVPSECWLQAMSNRAQRAIARASANKTILAKPSDLETMPLYEMARSGLRLADEASARRMLAKNPDIVRVIKEREDGPALGLYAYLPLNEFGAALIANGLFDGTQPDPAWICRKHEKPAAIYEWLFYGPGLYFRTLPAIDRLFSEVCPDGCALFSRGTTDISSGLLTKLGFIDARSLYPDAQPGFVVLLPETQSPAKKTAESCPIQIRQVRDFEMLAQVYSIRSATYIAEQFPLYLEEFDGNDFCATHFIGYIGAEPAGSVRIRYFGDFAKIERLAVKLEHRRSKLAFKLVRAAIEHGRLKGFTRFYGHASDEMVPFWKIFGGKILENRREFRFANIVYREMVAEYPPHPLAIKFGACPMVTIRPEGAWDEPAPLDWSNVIVDPTREHLLSSFARRRDLSAVPELKWTA